MSLPKRGGERWVYEIADQGNGIRANKYLPLSKPVLRSEREIGFEGGIAPEFIKSARLSGKWAWLGDPIPNPGFRG
jgi:hypothetical protein